MWAELSDFFLMKRISNSDGISLLRLGYKRTEASILVSHKSLNQGKPTLWRGLCYEGSRPSNDHFSELEIVFSSTPPPPRPHLPLGWELDYNLMRNLEPKVANKAAPGFLTHKNCDVKFIVLSHYVLR